MSETWSPECNYVPSRTPHEIVNKVSGQRLVDRVNQWLARFGRRTGIWMQAKLDPHHNVYDEKTMTWSIEVVPIRHFMLGWVKREHPDHAHFTKGIDTIFTAMRERFGLVPKVVRRKGNTEYHSPIGGMHLMMGADVFEMGTHWYRSMERFHRDLVTDYANRPYARWLLAHWMGEGSSVMFTRDYLMSAATMDVNPITRDVIFHRALHGASAIEPRFMASQKNSYLTWEFRFVGMVENARQMCAAVRLLHAWMTHHRNRIYMGKPSIRFNLTTARWDEMVTPEGARKHCRDWVESLGLDWADYESDFFERNYLMRIAHGKME